MGKNKRKIAFIICVNDDEFFEECQLYINQLEVPNGFVVETIPIRGAKSMCSGYNKGMAQSDAKYKVYMHQDVFIINPNFLNDIMEVFKISTKIAMIGVMGSPMMPASGVPEHGERIGCLYALDNENVQFNGYSFKKEHDVYDVQTIEGLIMVTREDIPWREDLFDGWDFYDASQSMEFIRRGYRIVVPEQKKPWVAHDESSQFGQWNFNKYRKIFLEEYGGEIGVKPVVKPEISLRDIMKLE